MDSFIRRAKYAAGAAVLDVVLAAVPRLSRTAPPWKVINISGSGDAYVQHGEELADQLVKSGLCDGQRIVEIGMGMGGNALALWKRFGDRISFRGFDIVRFAVTWTSQHFRQIGSGYEFAHADVYNSFYNPFGQLQPAAYRFPYEDGSADLILANSVFTHMQELELNHYFAEAARVLRIGGTAWFTFFLLDADSEAQLARKATAYSFEHKRGAARVLNDKAPDHAVAYPAEFVRMALERAGLSISSVQPGSWRGRGAGYFQDVVIAKR